MTKIDKIKELAIKKLNEEKRCLTDSNILSKMLELHDGEIIDVVNATRTRLVYE